MLMMHQDDLIVGKGNKIVYDRINLKNIKQIMFFFLIFELLNLTNDSQS